MSRRTFANLDMVLRTLKQLAAANQALGAVLCVTGRQGSIRSLFRCLRVSSDGRWSCLADWEYSNRRRLCLESFLSKPQQQETTLGAIFNASLFSALPPGETIDPNPFELTDPARVYVLKTSETQAGPLAAVLLIRPNSSIFDSANTESLALSDAVAAFPVVHVLELESRRSQLDARLSDLDKIVGRLRSASRRHRPYVFLVRRINRHFAETFRQLTDSHDARWYVAARESQTYQESFRLNTMLEKQRGERKESPRIIPLTARQGHPFVVNDLEQFFSSYPQLRYVLPKSSASTPIKALLTVPIVAFNDRQSPVVCVIELFSTRPFLPLHLDLAERVSDAYRQYSADMLTRLLQGKKIQNSGSSLRTSVSEVPFSLMLDRILEREQTSDRRFSDLPCPRELYDIVPLFVHDVLPLIRFALEFFCATTPCWLAYFRAINRDQSTLVLYRALVHYKCPFQPRPQISLGLAGSINAFVAREGEFSTVHDYSSPDWITSFPGMTNTDTLKTHDDNLSSFTAPVLAGSRVAGTLHLESFHKDAFAGIAPTATLLLAHLGTEMDESIKRRAADTAIDRCKNAIVRHEVRHMQLALSAFLESTTSHAPELRALVADQQRCLSELCRPDTTERLPLDTNNLGPLVAKCIALSDLKHRITWDRTSFDPHWLRPDAVSAIQLILHELIENAEEATRGTIQENSELRVEKERIGGIDFVLISLTNRFSRSIVRPDLPKLLFQSPIPATLGRVDRGNGALRVAALAHAIDAHVYLRDFDFRAGRLTCSLALPEKLFVEYQP